MLLLIIPENGAIRKTYGRDSLNFDNMFYPFWCFVIVLICTYSASADMELYPESKYFIPNGDSAVYEDVPVTNRNWKYVLSSPRDAYDRNINKNSGVDLAVPDDDPLRSHSLDGILKFLGRKHVRDLDDTSKRHGLVQRLLEEVRPYADADDYNDEEDDQFDQDWLKDDVEQNTQRILKQLRENSRKKIIEHLQSSANELPVHVDAESEETETTEEDPAGFAFVPPDPRYYETKNDPISVSEAQPISIPVSLPEKMITPSDGTKLQKNIEMPYRRDYTSLDGSTTPRKNFRQDLVSARSGEVIVQPKSNNHDATGVYIIAIVSGISAAAGVGLIAVGIGWYNLQKHVKNASDVEYPAYGITGPNKDVSPSNDRRLAQSAQMFHYQYQKQQMTAMEKAANGGRNGSVSELDTDEENEEGDHTVYECPGFAPIGEMEVKNPMYQDDPTPAQTPQVKQGNKE